VTYWLEGRLTPVTTKARRYMEHCNRNTQAHWLLVGDHQSWVNPSIARPDEQDTIRTPVMEFARVFDLNHLWQWK
jgi:hypothetical protein